MAEYLSIDEQSTTITISTDDWEIRFDEAKGGAIYVWYQGGGSTNYADVNYGLLAFSVYCTDTKSTYGATNSTMTLLELGVNRARILVSGELSNVSRYTFENYITVYPTGYIFYQYTFTNNTGGDLTSCRMNYIRLITNAGNYLSETKIADNNNNSTPTYNTEYWFGQYSSGLNSVYLYVIFINNPDAYNNSYVAVGQENYIRSGYVTCRHLSTQTTFCGLYIGGNETLPENIESDGEFLRDMMLG